MSLNQSKTSRSRHRNSTAYSVGCRSMHRHHIAVLGTCASKSPLLRLPPPPPLHTTTISPPPAPSHILQLLHTVGSAAPQGQTVRLSSPMSVSLASLLRGTAAWQLRRSRTRTTTRSASSASAIIDPAAQRPPAGLCPETTRAHHPRLQPLLAARRSPLAVPPLAAHPIQLPGPVGVGSSIHRRSLAPRDFGSPLTFDLARRHAQRQRGSQTPVAAVLHIRP